MCDCRFCTLRREIKAIVQKGDHREMIALIQRLAEMYWDTDEALNYENVIADGSWPQAVEILERRLARAREVRAKCRNTA